MHARSHTPHTLNEGAACAPPGAEPDGPRAASALRAAAIALRRASASARTLAIASSSGSCGCGGGAGLRQLYDKGPSLWV